MKKKNIKGKNTTKCGEVIPTNFTWVTLDKQKKIAQKLVDISKHKKTDI